MRENKNLRKEERGITLIALIITIVILVLITGVALRGLTGNTGIIDTAQVATDEYKVQQYKEQVAQLRENAIMEYAVMGKDVTIESLAELMNEETIWVKEVHANVNEGETNDDIIVTTTDGYIYQVYYDEKTGEKFVEYAGRGKEENLPKVLATYDKVKAKLHITARDEEGISKIEAIYRGEVEPERSIDAGGEKEREEEFSLEKTGWYIVKITSTRGQYRYAWIKVTSTVIAPTFKVVSNGTEKNSWYGADDIALEVEISTDNETATGIWYKVIENDIVPEEYIKVDGRSTIVTLNKTTGTLKIVANTVDKKGNISEDGTYTLLYDNTKPEITANINEKDGENGWYKGKITITLSDSTDVGSGIVGYYYWYQEKDNANDTDIELNKETYVEGTTAEFAINKDGVRTIGFKVIDKAGNVSGNQIFTDLKKDGQPPNTFTASVADSDKWPTYFIIKASTTDNLSGNPSINENYKLIYKYHILKGNEEVQTNQEWTESIEYTANNLIVNTDYTVYVEAKDQAGNIRETSRMTTSTYGALEKPTVTVQGGTTGKDNWHTDDGGRIHVEDSVDSTRTGVSVFKYKIDDETQEHDYDPANPPSLEEGEHKITVWGVDANGKKGKETTETIKKDTQNPAKPSIIVSSGTPGTTPWYISNVGITITAGEDKTPGSGAAQIEYSVNSTNNGPINGTSTTTQITNEGTITVTAYTIDKAGRKSEPETVNIYIDKTPPTASLTLDNSSKGSTIIVNAAGSDTVSQVASYTYQYKESTSNTWQTAATTTNTSYTYPTTMITSGKTYHLRVMVTDNAGLKAYSDGSNSDTGIGGNSYLTFVTNSAPTVPNVSVSGKTTNSFTISMNSTDADGDKLTYTLYSGDSEKNLTKVTNSSALSPNTKTTLTRSSLTQYTLYYYRVDVSDGIVTTTGTVNSVKTYCPGTGSQCNGPFSSRCSNCDGSGTVYVGSHDCPDCTGGQVWVDTRCSTPGCPGISFTYEICDKCRWSGRTYL